VIVRYYLIVLKIALANVISSIYSIKTLIKESTTPASGFDIYFTHATISSVFSEFSKAFTSYFIYSISALSSFSSSDIIDYKFSDFLKFLRYKILIKFIIN